MLRKIKISIRNLVESVLRSGDIDNTYMSITRATDGTRAHQKVQQTYGKNDKAELVLKDRLEYENFIIEVQGRADGILYKEEGFVIDEIKSTNVDLDKIGEDFNQLHWAQAMCYGYIYMKDNKLDKIFIQLTYFHLESEETKRILREYSFEELKNYFFNLVEKYLDWASITFYWLEERDRAIKSLNFPFTNYRKGQRELAVAVYGSIKNEKKIFAQAATGIGKTISTLFPSIKSIGEGLTDKIFYLTAKTITREAPLKSVKILGDKGLRLKVIVITAKEKICLNDQVKCNPKDCPYARGHFDRVNQGIRDIFQEEDFFTRDRIIDYSKKHRLCPFEFSLDLSLWADLIICDYNYVFNPQVQLKRFFDTGGDDYIFLIDEAHNLVDRARDMFSASLEDEEVVGLLPIFKDEYKPIYKGLNKLLNIFDLVREKSKGNKDFYMEDSIDDFYRVIKGLTSNLDTWLVEEKDREDYDKVIDFYFRLIGYNKIQDLYDDHYLTSFKTSDKGHEISLVCIDPSYLLRQVMELARSSVLFSATLSPLDYYMDLLGGNGRDYTISLPSPFPRKNLGVFIAPNISTRYKDRERTYPYIKTYIESFISSKKGNYLIFFPSYHYMEHMYSLFMEDGRFENIIVQNRNMSEEDREGFLREFKINKGVVAFAVIGGLFSEGVDLVGESLIGVGIIGVGMPRLGFERNMMKDYYDKYMGEGFDYAYTYPGINKVLQAGGRVIRSREDRGVILLIDDRYGSNKYKQLLPENWLSYRNIRGIDDLEISLSKFWKEVKSEDKI